MAESGLSLFAEVFAALAHPSRLEMIFVLAEGPRTAGELGRSARLSKANVSQHLKVLKARGLVRCDKRGTFCHYQLASRAVLEVCQRVRALILEQGYAADVAWQEVRTLTLSPATDSVGHE